MKQPIVTTTYAKSHTEHLILRGKSRTFVIFEVKQVLAF